MDTGAGRPVVPTEEQGLDQNAEGCVNIDCMQEEVVEVLLEGSVTESTGICGLSELELEVEAEAVEHKWDALSLDQNVMLQEHGPGSATENGNMRRDTEQVGEGVSSVSASGQTVRQLSWSRSQGLSLMIDVFIGRTRVPAIVDTAAQVSLMSSSLCRRLNLKSAEEQVQLRNAQVGSMMMGSVLKPTGVQIGGRSYFWELVEADINDSFILGLDFLTEETEESHQVQPGTSPVDQKDLRTVQVGPVEEGDRTQDTCQTGYNLQGPVVERCSRVPGVRRKLLMRCPQNQCWMMVGQGLAHLQSPA